MALPNVSKTEKVQTNSVSREDYCNSVLGSKGSIVDGFHATGNHYQCGKDTVKHYKSFAIPSRINVQEC